MMKKRNNSILQKDMTRCYRCGKTGNLHIHEVFYGTANRKQSIQYGCYVALCPEHHNMSNEAIHFDKEFDAELKDKMQRKFEELHSHDEFMAVFKKNYKK